MKQRTMNEWPMMRATAILSCIALLMFFESQAEASDWQNEDAEYAVQIEQARSRLEELSRSYPSINVAVGVGDRLVWTEAWGMGNVENGVAATPSSRYALYSVAKPITGLIAARLVEQGLLDPNAPIGTYLPNLPAHYGGVTSRHLLGHLAGIRHYDETGDDPYAPDQEWMQISARHCDSVDEALPQFINDPLIAEVGEYREYSSFGYTLLSRVLEAASGQAFSELAQDIFDDASADTITIDDPTESLPRTTLYAANEAGTFRRTPPLDNSCRFGGGGFSGSASDLALIGLAYANGTLLSAEGEALIQTPILPRSGESFSGYGFAVGEAEREGIAFTTASHGGGALGGRSYIFVIPSHDVSVAIVGNLEGVHFYEAAFDIGYLFAGIPPRSDD